MKSVIRIAAAAIALAAPVVSFAQQDNPPLTRAQVRAQLIQIENAGYHPGHRDINFPDDFLAAEARVAAENGGPSSTGVGGVSSGASELGHRAAE
ncbi:DUF4148 domain-containing protein [Paraburkholderia phytofirmans]|uniref:DUF4148 domain-containing protein n=1 Tax=Paraburkholderia TaxID=1822464 RepID=UPI0009EEC829|nr:DUF4148 domain-containing protein [Paraburkholderia phytofirmans]